MDSDKVSGILSKIEDKAGLLGGLLGFINDPMVDEGGFNANMMKHMYDAVCAWKVKDPMWIMNREFSRPDLYPILPNAVTAISGWVLSQFGSTLDPRLAQVGRIIKKYGVAALFSNIASGFIWQPLWNPGEAGGTAGGIGTHGMTAPGTTSPMWSGSPGGPGSPHATANDGYKSALTWERVV